jgi:HPt (histidine-containing phosphotransfer) domain-containing protein
VNEPSRPSPSPFTPFPPLPTRSILWCSCSSPSIQIHYTDRAAFLPPLRRSVQNDGKPDFDVLSNKGHFLKGSSSTLGFTKIEESCKIIQQYGKHQDIDGNPQLDDKVCLEKITTAIKALKADSAQLEVKMKAFYNVG